jgi:hypothetical protein
MTAERRARLDELVAKIEGILEFCSHRVIQLNLPFYKPEETRRNFSKIQKDSIKFSKKPSKTPKSNQISNQNQISQRPKNSNSPFRLAVQKIELRLNQIFPLAVLNFADLLSSVLILKIQKIRGYLPSQGQGVSATKRSAISSRKRAKKAARRPLEKFPWQKPNGSTKFLVFADMGRLRDIAGVGRAASAVSRRPGGRDSRGRGTFLRGPQDRPLRRQSVSSELAKGKPQTFPPYFFYFRLAIPRQIALVRGKNIAQRVKSCPK